MPGSKGTMNIRYYIWLLSCLLFFAGHVNAQFSGGSVIMHSDPRLSVMLKKNPVAAPPPTRVRNPEMTEEGRRSPNRNSPKGTDIITASSLKGGRGPNQPVVNSPAAVTRTTHSEGPAIHRDGKVIYTGKGFRVQIYNGYDREKANKVRLAFMKLFPGTYTYLSYVSPGFRVRVGDYRSRDQAAGMLKEANSIYPSPCMIVPDQITVHED